MPSRLELNAPDFETRFQEFLNRRRVDEDNVDGVVADILEQVRTRGDDALIELTKKFDRFEVGVENLRITDEEIDRAADSCDAESISALKTAAARIREFHRRQIPEDLSFTDDEGWQLGYRWRPLASVGIYVPGGQAAYPSSVLMNAVPATTVGVSRIVMVVPTPDGTLNPLVLAAAQLAGVHEVYRVGGAQAVAALAFGTVSIDPVDKIVGPGNAYVAAAKRQVFGTVGIDMIAGPSEILVVADGDNDPDWIAADLLAQAEHDASAQAILVTDDGSFADKVVAAVEEQLRSLPRADIAGESWRVHGTIIVANQLESIPALVDRIAPEHLELAVADPAALAERIQHAGAIFLGKYAPEAVGDYIAGPNHVLPTNRTARFASGLSVFDFLKRSSMISGNRQAIEAVGAATITLARAEGLDAHARSVAMRLGNDPAKK